MTNAELAKCNHSDQASSGSGADVILDAEVYDENTSEETSLTGGMQTNDLPDNTTSTSENTEDLANPILVPDRQTEQGKISMQEESIGASNGSTPTVDTLDDTTSPTNASSTEVLDEDTSEEISLTGSGMQTNELTDYTTFRSENTEDLANPILVPERQTEQDMVSMSEESIDVSNESTPTVDTPDDTASSTNASSTHYEITNAELTKCNHSGQVPSGSGADAILDADVPDEDTSEETSLPGGGMQTNDLPAFTTSKSGNIEDLTDPILVPDKEAEQDKISMQDESIDASNESTLTVDTPDDTASSTNASSTQDITHTGTELASCNQGDQTPNGGTYTIAAQEDMKAALNEDKTDAEVAPDSVHTDTESQILEKASTQDKPQGSPSDDLLDQEASVGTSPPLKGSPQKPSPCKSQSSHQSNEIPKVGAGSERNTTGSVGESKDKKDSSELPAGQTGSIQTKDEDQDEDKLSQKQTPQDIPPNSEEEHLGFIHIEDEDLTVDNDSQFIDSAEAHNTGSQNQPPDVLNASATAGQNHEEEFLGHSPTDTAGQDVSTVDTSAESNKAVEKDMALTQSLSVNLDNIPDNSEVSKTPNEDSFADGGKTLNLPADPHSQDISPDNNLASGYSHTLNRHQIASDELLKKETATNHEASKPFEGARKKVIKRIQKPSSKTQQKERTSPPGQKEALVATYKVEQTQSCTSSTSATISQQEKETKRGW
ncbi:uncharacterized protein [Amphiura filiformis]|uniref:uncharacterized protein n=1 Tax=Amphiura filiformis TaxID=82378 RepID=UPI003B2181DF